MIFKKIQNGLVASSIKDLEELKKITDGEYVEVNIKHGKSRSLKQLRLYWVCCQLVADNTTDKNFDTKEKVSEQCKISARFVDYWFTYTNQKTGQETLNIKTKTISFENVDTVEVCKFFDEAFKYMSDLLKISVKELTENANGSIVVEELKETFSCREV